jgi:hypothetical protein
MEVLSGQVRGETKVEVRVKKEDVEQTETPRRSSPDSSTDRLTCPQCGQGQADEPHLVEHLLTEHQIHMVTPNTTTSLTRCPVCRKGVADLSHHFALEHEDSTRSTPAKIARSTVTRIIPIVLPNHPVPQAHLPSSSDEPRQLSRDYSSPRSGNSSDGGSSVTNGVTILPAMKIYKNGSTSSSSPTPSLNDNPVNLTVKKNNNVIVEDDPVDDIGHDQAMYIAQAASQLGRKRRKQTHVPDDNKDEKYWARRLKNNEAAKKSRDMRIKREKVIFEENIRLETMVKELRSENENLLTENKELHLKLGLILDENARLKSIMSDK